MGVLRRGIYDRYEQRADNFQNFGDLKSTNDIFCVRTFASKANGRRTKNVTFMHRFSGGGGGDGRLHKMRYIDVCDITIICGCEQF